MQITLPQKALAIHLITKSSLSETSKENVMAKVDTGDHEKLYTNVAKVMRELKTLASSERNNAAENRTLWKKLSRETRRLQ